MLEPILVNCISRSAKEAWLSQLNKVLKASRYPSHGSSASQVLTTLPASVQRTQRGRLVRQNAFDYDNGEEVTGVRLPDENDNFQDQNQNQLLI